MRSFWAGLALALFVAAGGGLAINYAWPLSTKAVYSTKYTTV